MRQRIVFLRMRLESILTSAFSTAGPTRLTNPLFMAPRTLVMQAATIVVVPFQLGMGIGGGGMGQCGWMLLLNKTVHDVAVGHLRDKRLWEFLTN